MSNGVLKQAATWAEGLRGFDHEVDFVGIQANGIMSRLRDYDIVHFFQHGHWLKGFRSDARGEQPWFFSPIIDSTASVRLYGLLGKLPLEHYLLSFGPRVLGQFSMCSTVSVRSSHERAYIEAVAPNAKIADNPIAVTMSDGEVERPKVDLPSEFVLFVGNVAAERKNVYRLVEACDRSGIPLVLGGLEVKSAEMKRIEARIDRAKVPVVRLGFISERQLRWLYQHCSVFCLPSLVEGVGQVAMEALYFGAPVVVTEVGGPPDYFSNFARYVNPHSVAAISLGICAALKTSVDFSAARQHLEQYSIENTARRLLDSYEAAL
jgi:glycosyltransferase involved in cell wall biosynthesis